MIYIISIGTFAVVWTAAGFPDYARENKALTVGINQAAKGCSHIYDMTVREKAGVALDRRFVPGTGSTERL